VYVVKDAKAEERIVTLGDRAAGHVEVTSGVAKGESVIVDPRGRITDGMAVSVK
jgi:multidrug efflux pump subunit AcrA (membrane-fusion protein)